MSTYKVQDNSANGVGTVVQLLQHFFPYAQKQLGFHKPVMISFDSDEDNASKLLGRTGQYNPDDFSISIYVDSRHPKDILRSLSHELVHHAQNCNGDFDSADPLGAGYAQENPAMRNAELDAYKRGNIIFRDFEDLIKKGKINVNINFEEAGEPKMSLKEWKHDEINTLLMEKWGYGKKAKTLSEEDKEKIMELAVPSTESGLNPAGYRDEDKPKKPAAIPPEEEEELEEGWVGSGAKAVGKGAWGAAKLAGKGAYWLATSKEDRELQKATDASNKRDWERIKGVFSKGKKGEEDEGKEEELEESQPYGHPDSTWRSYEDEMRAGRSKQAKIDRQRRSPEGRAAAHKARQAKDPEEKFFTTGPAGHEGRKRQQSKASRYRAGLGEKKDLEEADDPLQAAMKRCGDKAKSQGEYDECMKGATPSGKPRHPSPLDAKELEEGCPPDADGAPAPVDDISQMSPEEAFAAGMAAAKDAIDQAIGGDVPPEGGGALDENSKISLTLDEARDVARRIFERITKERK